MADNLYLDARAQYPSPQSIPPGYMGFFDWGDLGDEDAAKRGMIAYRPPVFDRDYERLDWSFAEGEDGAWTAEAKVVPGDAGRAERAALASLADRRWGAEVGGMEFGGSRVATDRETQGKVTSAYLKASMDPNFAIEDWKIAPGVFVTLDAAAILLLGNALTAHVQACFSREAVIAKAIVEASDAFAKRSALTAEIDKGWPGQDEAAGA